VDLTSPTALAMPLRDGDRLFVPYKPEYHFLPSVEIAGESSIPARSRSRRAGTA
jgi:hypothetical protein